eukprot:TRINITY_DN3991_c0_g1_i4.p1 TRINITY_DN3991_c0_g1~~TRINITY_DN3991_c0_g1_i4.p1  ORF type:complete len:551 (+),score=39.84 TRINITY_DN3991_c0_g1_i4:199-1653(+)
MGAGALFIMVGLHALRSGRAEPAEHERTVGGIISFSDASALEKCLRPATKCNKSAGHYFAECPEGKLCHRSGCVNCKEGHHICDPNKPHWSSTCPNDQHCTGAGCAKGYDPDLGSLEQCCGPPQFPVTPAPTPLPPVISPLDKCPRAPTKCDKSAGHYFAKCPEGKLCHKSGCVDCKEGHHICNPNKPHWSSTCPNDQHCTGAGCAKGYDPDLGSLEQCCGPPQFPVTPAPTPLPPVISPLDKCPRPPTKCDKSAGHYFAKCPEGKLCHKSGCVNCKEGHHICDPNKPHWSSTCPNDQHCTGAGCAKGYDPDLGSLEQCCGPPQSPPSAEPTQQPTSAPTAAEKAKAAEQEHKPAEKDQQDAPAKAPATAAKGKAVEEQQDATANPTLPPSPEPTHQPTQDPTTEPTLSPTLAPAPPTAAPTKLKRYRCTGWPKTTGGINLVERCEKGNELADGYVYKYNTGRWTDNRVCRNRCWCCRAKIVVR